MPDTVCPNCQNKIGFVFGTCIECGFNHISNTFKWIKVYVSELPSGERDYYIDRHMRNTLREPSDGS